MTKAENSRVAQSNEPSADGIAADLSPTGGGNDKRAAPLRLVSMFSGIGGFEIGLERSGAFEAVAVAEMDAYASKVLALRFPDVPNLGDVTKADYPDADAICAGFPCQDISYAGAGAGLAGARSGLFWEVVRAISVVRPSVVILENVAALLSRGLDTVLRALAEIGYDAEWHCIPASAVGAPHRRDRIWIIAHPRGEQHEGSRAPLSGEIAAELFIAAANAQSDGQPLSGAGDEGRNAVEACCVGVRNEPCGDCAGDGAGHLADAGCLDAQGLQSSVADAQEWQGSIQRQVGPCDAGFGGQWLTEPAVGRVAHGVPNRVDRLRCLGNAIVPQVAEVIGRAIARHRTTSMELAA